MLTMPHLLLQLVLLSSLLHSGCIIRASTARESISSTDSHQNVNSIKDEECLDETACADKLGFDAIVALHKILDDDENGAVDVSESDEFLREELQYENGYEKRHNAFHRNDKYISVKELWEAWKKSEVHNWTVIEATEWLKSSVDLPQYEQTFQVNRVDGTSLPRLAVNNMHFLSNILGIKDPIHKQKIALKAMDVVLFGSPKFGRNFIKDCIVVTSIVIAIGGCWFAYVQHKCSQQHLKKMIKDLDSLQKAEDALMVLQEELDKAHHEQETAAQEKKNLEKRLQNEMAGAKKDTESKDSDEERSRMKCLEKELHEIQGELRVAHKQLEEHRWIPPPALQLWLQLTHELELRNYNAKKAAAENQLALAKEGCEKLRKKRSSLMGAFRVAHGSSIDDVDSRILQAKASLTEVTTDLRERLQRWRQIESLCGFHVVNNPGLVFLQSALHGSSVNGGLHLRPIRHGTLSRGSLISASQDDLDDAETLSAYGASISADGDLHNGYHKLRLNQPSLDDYYIQKARRGAVQQLVHQSASMFLASVPPSYAQCTAWQADVSRSSPPHHRELEGGSHPNLSSLVSSSSTAGTAGHPMGNGNASPTFKRSRSAGSETLEPMMKVSPRNISNENLTAVIEEDGGLSIAESNSVTVYERPVFSLGEAPVILPAKISKPAPDTRLEALSSSNKLKPPPSFSRFIKSHSQEHSSPPKEVPPPLHSNSESSLTQPSVLQKKKTSFNPFRPNTSAPLLDEENSTDSSSIADDEKKERKKRFTLPVLRRSHHKKSS